MYYHEHLLNHASMQAHRQDQPALLFKRLACCSFTPTFLTIWTEQSGLSSTWSKPAITCVHISIFLLDSNMAVQDESDPHAHPPDDTDVKVRSIKYRHPSCINELAYYKPAACSQCQQVTALKTVHEIHCCKFAA